MLQRALDYSRQTLTAIMFTGIFSKIPNWLTLFRVAIVPLIIAIYYLPDTWLVMPQKNLVATILFVLASITDWLDGFIARHFNMNSPFGEFLDPVADKLLVCSTLIVLVQLGRVSAFIALIIIGREIAISALREWMALLQKRVRVSKMGKVKTTVQLIGIGFLLYYGEAFGIPLLWIIRIGDVLIIIAAIFTIISMIEYLIQAYRTLKEAPLV